MQNKVIDLTQLLNEEMPVYPGTPAPILEISNIVEKDGFTERRLNMVSHTGTHIDAPCHILQNAKSLTSFPPDKFIGPAMVIPCKGMKEIGLEFIQTFETQISKVDFIIFYTGWQDKWNTRSYFEDCPVPTREAAIWLTKFKLKGLGVDAFSLDKIVPATIVTEENLPNHYIFLGKEILLIENLTNIDQLPEANFSFQCFPLKIENADGSPVRAIAIINE